MKYIDYGEKVAKISQQILNRCIQLCDAKEEYAWFAAHDEYEDLLCSIGPEPATLCVESIRVGKGDILVRLTDGSEHHFFDDVFTIDHHIEIYDYIYNHV